MYRVYRLFGHYRYYWRGQNIWTEWAWAALPLSFAEAQQVAQSQYARFERFGSLRKCA